MNALMNKENLLLLKSMMISEYFWHLINKKIFNYHSLYKIDVFKYMLAKKMIV